MKRKKLHSDGNKSPCSFCEMLTGRTERIIEASKHSLAIFSNPRLVKGHLLVIPKRHVLRLSELNAGERTDLFENVLRFHQKVIDRIAPGCDIRSNYRPFIAQSRLKVDHAHVHLLPRHHEDELYRRSMRFEKEIFRNLTETQRRAILKKLMNRP